LPGEGEREVSEEGRDLEVDDDERGGVEQYESSTGRIFVDELNEGMNE
jgi:hypothetical protein